MSTPSDDSAAKGHEPLRCTGAALRRMTRLTNSVYDDALRPLGLKLTQFSLLINIRDAVEPEGPSITGLSDRMMMDRTTLTRNLAPLRKAGLVQVGGRGGQARRISLTEAGRELLGRAVPVWRAAELRVRATIGEGAARDLRDLLEAAGARLRGRG